MHGAVQARLDAWSETAATLAALGEASGLVLAPLAEAGVPAGVTLTRGVPPRR